MNRRRFSWRSFPILAGIFAVFLIVRLPASFATLVLPPEIQLRGVEGSFWDGRTSAVGVGDVLVQEQVSWRFLPRALLEGKLSWAVSGRLADQASRLELAVRPSGAELNGVSLTLPLEPLAALHPQLKAAQLGATLRVTAKRLGINSPVVASVTVERLFTPLSPQRALGNYRVDLKGDAAGKGDWRIATLGGGLRVAGQGAFDAAQPRINGKLTLTPQSPIPGLSPLLASLPKAGEGFVMTF